jgi:hypothetical protein
MTVTFSPASSNIQMQLSATLDVATAHAHRQLPAGKLLHSCLSIQKQRPYGPRMVDIHQRQHLTSQLLHSSVSLQQQCL